MTATAPTTPTDLLPTIEQTFRDLAYLGVDVLGAEAAALLTEADVTLTAWGAHPLPSSGRTAHARPVAAGDLFASLETHLRELADASTGLDDVLRATQAADLVHDARGHWLATDVPADEM